MIMELNFYVKDKSHISRKRDTSRRYNSRHYNDASHAISIIEIERGYG